MRWLLLLPLGALLWALPHVPSPAALAQSGCQPDKLEFLMWGTAGQSEIPAPTDTAGFVPSSEVWQIRAAGIATTDGSAREYMLEIQHTVWSQGNACCWMVPVHRHLGTALGTPTLALERPVVLHEGERLGARANSLSSTAQMALLWVGWKFPASCTERLVTNW